MNILNSQNPVCIFHLLRHTALCPSTLPSPPLSLPSSAVPSFPFPSRPFNKQVTWYSKNEANYLSSVHACVTCGGSQARCKGGVRRRAARKHTSMILSFFFFYCFFSSCSLLSFHIQGYTKKLMSITLFCQCFFCPCSFPDYHIQG